MKIVSWNMQNLKRSWDFLVDQHQDADFAFVQEACTPTRYVREHAAHWDIPHALWQVRPRKYQQEVLRIAGDWDIERIKRDSIPGLGMFGERLLNPRFRAVAVAGRQAEPDVCLICVITGPKHSLRLADTVRAIRRTLCWEFRGAEMPLIVAGDLTTNPSRTPETFKAMAEIGMFRVGADAPNYIQKSLKEQPKDARRHLNHVFVSERLADRVSVTTLNDPDENSAAFWGPSDHCRILIEVDE